MFPNGSSYREKNKIRPRQDPYSKPHISEAMDETLLPAETENSLFDRYDSIHLGAIQSNTLWSIYKRIMANSVK